jgi:hypothetical protein
VGNLQSMQVLLSTGYDENVCASATSFALVMARDSPFKNNDFKLEG